jgi:hypothetical protein
VPRRVGGGDTFDEKLGEVFKAALLKQTNNRAQPKQRLSASASQTGRWRPDWLAGAAGLETLHL